MDELEQYIDRELKRLPEARAPRTLLPRVLQAVAAAEPAPWYARAWFTWPREYQIYSAALLALVVAGLWWLIPSGQQWVVDAASPVASRAYSRLATAFDWAGQVAALGRVIWNLVLQPIALSFLALTIVVSLLCAALWTAVNRVALGGASS